MKLQGTSPSRVRLSITDKHVMRMQVELSFINPRFMTTKDSVFPSTPTTRITGRHTRLNQRATGLKAPASLPSPAELTSVLDTSSIVALSPKEMFCVLQGSGVADVSDRLCEGSSVVSD